jgi:murein DD-endopeptidase MepM/ murein hydrolase activator NlpD
VVSLAAACGGAADGEPRSLPREATHAGYTETLVELGLDQVAYGRDWLAAAARALERPVPVTLPFAEHGYLAADVPGAVGFRFDLDRGRRLVIDITWESTDGGRLFVDLFELRDEEPPRRVDGLAPGETTLEHDVRRTGPYVLRVQPEILRGGRYRVTQRTEASLRSPVSGFAVSTISSGFGAPRDGGARDHHGIDIFRPRGTPVVAAADGVVSLDETPRGGRVVWLRDARTRRNIYYAHLDDWAVTSGAMVRAGDVLGYIGNTGNARTTPPHLHFGVYERGPADPVPYLRRDDPAPPIVTAPIDVLGGWMQVAGRRATLRALAPAPDATPAPLPVGAAVRVLAAVGDSYRVLLPNGLHGLLRARDLAPAAAPPPRLPAPSTPFTSAQ